MALLRSLYLRPYRSGLIVAVAMDAPNPCIIARPPRKVKPVHGASIAGRIHEIFIR
jgi:hypothetical protein